MRACFLLGLGLLVACTSVDPSTNAAADASAVEDADADAAAETPDANSVTDAGHVAKDGAGTTGPEPDPTPPPPPTPMPSFDCEAHLTVDQLKPATCAVVDPVSHRVGHLQWVCAGGPARLTLGSLVLTGTVTGHTASLFVCREDPVSWLSGHYETVSVELELVVKKGALGFERATGLACPKVYTDCSGTAGVVLEP